MSKGLEALELLKSIPEPLSLGCETTLGSLHVKEFDFIEKDLKALDFIREHTMYLKNVNTFVFVDLNESVIERLKEILL